MKVNLEVFNKKDLQTFLALLNEFESNNISDVRFVRKNINDYLTTDRLATLTSLKESGLRKKSVIMKLPLCPSCGKTRMEHWPNPEALSIRGCSLCRYSEVA